MDVISYPGLNPPLISVIERDINFDNVLTKPQSK